MNWCSSIMFVFIDFVLSVVFSVQFAVFLLAFVGIYAICWWLIDNLSSVVQVVRTLLQPYFQPQEDLSLIDRYGNWAGMFCLWKLILSVFFISCLYYTHSMNLNFKQLNQLQCNYNIVDRHFYKNVFKSSMVLWVCVFKLHDGIIQIGKNFHLDNNDVWLM